MALTGALCLTLFAVTGFTNMLSGHLRHPCKDLLVVMAPVPSYEELIWLFEAEPVHRYADDECDAGYQLDWRELWPYGSISRMSRRLPLCGYG